MRHKIPSEGQRLLRRLSRRLEESFQKLETLRKENTDAIVDLALIS